MARSILRLWTGSTLAACLAFFAGCGDDGGGNGNGNGNGNGDNKPPTKPTVTISPASPTTLDELKANVTGSTDPDGDTVFFTYTWYKDGETQAGLTAATVPASLTAKGQGWRVEVVASDGKLTSEKGGALVTIANSRPSATITLAPANPGDADDLVVTSSTADADSDTVSLSYEWAVDGMPPGQSAATVPASATEPGQTWRVTVTPNDGEEDGASETAEVTIAQAGNRPPTLAMLLIVPASGNETTTFTCNPQNAMDPDGDPVTFTYRWTVNGAAATSSAAIDGSSFDRGDEIRCEATPNDGMVDGAPVQSQAITIANAPPSIGTVAIGPSQPRESDTIRATITGAVDADGDAVTYEYSWLVNRAPVATSTTIDGSRFDKGQQIVLSVTPTDGTDRGMAVRSNTLTGGNSPPSLVSVSIQPSPASGSDDLRAIPAGFSDPDPVDQAQYSFAWFVNGTQAPGATGVLPRGGHRRGDQVTVRATPTDGTDSGTPVTSAPITIGNSAPGAPVVAVLPANPAARRDNLTCSITTPAQDIDNDPITYRYVWRRNNSATTVTSSVVPASLTRGQDNWTCIVTPNDGTVDGPTAQASALVNESCDSLRLDGTNDYVHFRPSSQFQFTTGATVEAWVQWSGPAAATFDQAIYTHRPSSNSVTLGVFGNGSEDCACPGHGPGQVYFRWGTSCAQNTCVRSTTALNTGAWTHVAGVWANGTATLYVNGRLAGTLAGASAIEAVVATSSAAIGAKADGSGAFFPGVIGEVRVSTSARYLTAFTPPQNLDSTGATIGHWSLDEGRGVTATDISNNGHTGRIAGGATWVTQGPACAFNAGGLATQLATAFCQHRTRCEPAYYPFLAYDETTCLAEETTRNTLTYTGFAATIAAGRMRFDQQRFDACIQAYATSDCELGLDLGVCDFLIGQQPLNAPCGVSNECASGLFCPVGQFGMCAGCARQPGPGESCGGGETCAAGSNCYDVGGGQLMCISERSELGQPCGTIPFYFCRGHLQCVGFGAATCELPSHPGDMCDENNFGPPACDIYFNQTCFQGTCTTVTWGGQGQSCLPPDGCIAQAFCDATGTCQGLPTAGQLCQNGACARGFYCSAGVCAAEIPSGGACVNTASCGTNQFCISGTCQNYTWTQCP